VWNGMFLQNQIKFTKSYKFTLTTYNKKTAIYTALSTTCT